MTKILLAGGLLVVAAAWVGLLGMASPAPSGSAGSSSVAAPDGSRAQIMFVDKSRFAEKDPITGDAGEITLRVLVQDGAGNPLGGLKQDDFQVLEEGRAGRIKALKGGGGSGDKINVILVMDISGSMSQQGKMEGAKRAALAALNELKADRDRIGLIVFDDIYDVLQPLATLSADVKRHCESAISGLHPRNGTAIGPPTLAAVEMIRNARPDGAKMVLVMTDGEDAGLAAMTPAIAAESDRQGVQVHSIAFGLPLESSAKTMLTELAKRCQGEFRHAPSSQELAEIFRKRVKEMATFYTLVYDSPYPEADGLPRDVSVFVNSPTGALAAKGGYQVGPILGGRSTPAKWATQGGPGSATTSGTSAGIYWLLFLVLLALLGGGLAVPTLRRSMQGPCAAPATAAAGPFPAPVGAPLPRIPAPPPPAVARPAASPIFAPAPAAQPLRPMAPPPPPPPPAAPGRPGAGPIPGQPPAAVPPPAVPRPIIKPPPPPPPPR
jgi:VWFA-related protein